MLRAGSACHHALDATDGGLAILQGRQGATPQRHLGAHPVLEGASQRGRSNCMGGHCVWNN
eukprot:5374339-Pyramimonas_sp.AAC.4